MTNLIWVGAGALLVALCAIVGALGHKLPFEAPERDSNDRKYW